MLTNNIQNADNQVFNLRYTRTVGATSLLGIVGKPPIASGYINMPLYTPTIKFTHLKSKLQFSYQINKSVQEVSSYTFYFNDVASIKVANTFNRDYFDYFSDIIEGKVWNGTSFEMFPFEDTYCYLIFDGRYYKIGKSNEPNKRLKELRTANPSCELIGCSKNVPEKFLQSAYRHKLYSREWFDLEMQDVNFIKSLMSISDYEQTKCVMRMCSRLIDRNKPKTKEIKTKALSSIKLTFGKYKGTKVSEMLSLPQRDYLKYLKSNWTSNKNTVLYEAICKQIEGRIFFVK